MSRDNKASLKNCWEILGCERHARGNKVLEFGECSASKTKMGHSCWAVSGTLCGGKVSKSHKEKQISCKSCDVYRLYHRSSGKHGRVIKKLYPEEDRKYHQIMINRLIRNNFSDSHYDNQQYFRSNKSNYRGNTI